MRLDRVYIDGFKNLKDVNVDFDQTKLTTVLIGQNGTGKSNLIEAICEVFRCVDLDDVEPRFRYKIDYIIGNHRVTLEKLNSKTSIAVDGNAIARAVFDRDRGAYFPDLVFGYYSGGSRKLESIFDTHQRRYYGIINKELHPEDYNAARISRRLFYCRPVHGAMALLSFFAFPSNDVADLLRDKLGISGFHSALGHLRQPSWFNATSWRASLKKGQTTRTKKLAHHSFEDSMRPPAHNLWGARGPAGECARALRNCAFHPIALEGKVIDDYRDRSQTEMQLACFLRNGADLRDFATSYSSDRELFQALEAIDISDMLRDLHVWVMRKDDSSGEVGFGDLSDGERQLLMVLGLIRVSRGQRVLFLLDEPDTHLNPVWQYSYLDLLEQWMGVASEREKCHIILTTHNPIVVGGLKRNQVRILQKTGELVKAVEPEDDPSGVGIEGLLKSELYGLRSTLAPTILAKLDEQYALLGKNDKTPEETKQLRTLALELNELGVAHTHPNPYFEQFAGALANRRAAQPSEVLSAAEIEHQTELAKEILNEVIKEEKDVRSSAKE